jgi:hypothetical protein
VSGPLLVQRGRAGREASSTDLSVFVAWVLMLQEFALHGANFRCMRFDALLYMEAQRMRRSRCYVIAIICRESDCH